MPAESYRLATGLKSDNCSNRHMFCMHKIVAVIIMLASSGLTVVNQYAVRNQSKEDFEFTSLLIDAGNNIILALVAIFGMYGSNSNGKYIINKDNNAAYKLTKKIDPELKSMLKNGPNNVKDKSNNAVQVDISSLQVATDLTNLDALPYSMDTNVNRDKRDALYPPVYEPTAPPNVVTIDDTLIFEHTDNYDRIRVINKKLGNVVIMDRSTVMNVFGYKVVESMGEWKAIP